MKTALVLAGGGVAGVAWELGVLRGIQQADPELADQVLAADVMIGTSAGSSVAAQVTGGVPLDDLYQRQLGPAPALGDVQIDMGELTMRFAAAAKGATSRTELRQRIGAVAIATDAGDAAQRRAVIAARLPSDVWPDRNLLVTAVNAETGEPVVFTRDSGVELVDAVMASCAVPGVWPTVTVNGSKHMDGGIRSITNADLAIGCDRVLVLTPQAKDAPSPLDRLPAEIEALAPAPVFVVYGDAATRAAFGTNPLALATRGPAARAGFDVGKQETPAIREFWR